MNITINPFQQLYFSDDAQSAGAFVELFSNEVLQTAVNPIFQGGNVVLSGTQGCGKTMILNLLRPETRFAYSQRGIPFPVDESMRNFISAGVNLTRSRIADLVQVTLNRGEQTDQRELPSYFADFFNYLVVLDLIKSVEFVAANPSVFNEIVDQRRMDEFVHLISEQDCWFGALSGATNLSQLKQRLDARIEFYRKWVNGNVLVDQPADLIRSTKTNIGEPVSRAAECLRISRMISEDVPVLIRVDQIEELHRSFVPRQQQLLLAFRKVLNRAFAARDARVHYRAGTRRYGWRNEAFMGIWGSESRLENRRDYHLIDMDDELFRRGESQQSIFNRFAADAFQKRVNYYFRDEAPTSEAALAKQIFGANPGAEKRIEPLSGIRDDAQIDRALALDASVDEGRWTQEWRAFLRNLFRSGHVGMLDAVLAAAWGRQTGGARFKREHREDPPPTDAPWRERTWWRKERLDQAVLQLMTRCQQRFMWWGYGDICSLSGGNITVFLHVCHRIWDGFLKNESSLPHDLRNDLFVDREPIDKNIQAAGILFASNEWFNKLPEEPGGDSRKAFVEKLALKLNGEMLRDARMSYPGANGFSVKLSDLDSSAIDASEMRRFLEEAVGYGVLFEAEHKSKSKSDGLRRKYYLNPILCPRFQLPEARTKEPVYWNLDDLLTLARRAGVPLARPSSTLSTKLDSAVLSLFEEEGA